MNCTVYEPNRIFHNFIIVNFPKTFVGLKCTKHIHIDCDLNTTGYIKTSFKGQLIKFEEAREISASHRAFEINQINNYTLKITFEPTNECISKARPDEILQKCFLIPLHVIKVDERCYCNKELHSETIRLYICGYFEYVNVSHCPKIISFGEIIANNNVTKTVNIRNGSDVHVRLEYLKSTGFITRPTEVIISPNSEKTISVIAQPPSLNFNKVIKFKITNANNKYENETKDDSFNYLNYEILTEQTFKCRIIARPCLVESLHKLYEKNKMYTYVGNEIAKNYKAKQIAKHYIFFCESQKKKKIGEFTSNRSKCCISYLADKLNDNFCASPKTELIIYDVSQILFKPYTLDFGSVCARSYASESLTIQNNTNVDISLTLLANEYLRYTQNRLSYKSLKIKATDDKTILIICDRQIEGRYEGTFAVKIEERYCLKLPYSVYVGNPMLTIENTVLNFGMTNKDIFTTTNHVNIYNYFNVSLEFDFKNLYDDLPFDIVPRSGVIPKRKCQACSISLVTPSELKRHEVVFVSTYGEIHENIPIELNVINGKWLIKFSTKEIIFKDVPFNLVTIRKVELENSSNERVTFTFVDPLVSGFEIIPMSGIIESKSVISFELKIKIPCVMKFSFDLSVKINNKEIKKIPVSGNITGPEVIVQPKIIIVPRIPTYMITYTPVVFQNVGMSRAFIEFVNTGYKYMFGFYLSRGDVKEKITDLYIESGSKETIYIRVFAPFRHQYEFYLPLKINGLLGPPNEDPASIESVYYVDQYLKLYENHPNIKVKTIGNEICYCKMSGVFTTTWIKFSRDDFELYCDPARETALEFTMTNVWKEIVPVTVEISKLGPYFRLELLTESFESIIDENELKFELEPNAVAAFRVTLLPNNDKNVVRVAPLFLDKLKLIAYFNLTFVGVHRTCTLEANTYRIVFPPATLNSNLSRKLSLTIDEEVSIEEIFVHCEDEDCITINFLEENIDKKLRKSNFVVEIHICSKIKRSNNTIITFSHCEYTDCEIEVVYCCTSCPLTLHANAFIDPNDNPCPYFPTEENDEFFNYMTTTLTFLENWMFEEGFKKCLYPIFPYTFHVTASFLKNQNKGSKKKRMDVSYINFVERVAGSLFQQSKEKSSTGASDSYETVKEVCDVYENLIKLLISRKADLYLVRPRYLLSFEHFVLSSKNVPLTTRAEQIESEKLLNNEQLFNRLSKQSWFDLVIQTYKVFIVDTCFFECVCENSRDRDIVNVLIEWYNENIKSQYKTLFKKENNDDAKQINNLTNDLSDGIALISTILKYCPFLTEHFIDFRTTDDENLEGSIINNACLIIEAMMKLKINFPLNTNNLLYPNFVQMLFLSVQLYVILPMYAVKGTINFNPPLLQSSSRILYVSPVEQENVHFESVILNNSKNCFSVEKESSGADTKKSCFVVKYQAKFVEQMKTVLIFYGSSETRIFDSYVVFLLVGNISSAPPLAKYKLSSPIYISKNVSIPLVSPFPIAADFWLSITDKEPVIPVEFENTEKPKFYLQRLTLKENVLQLEGKSTNKTEVKLSLKMLCISTQTSTSWIWFRSDIGEFSVKVVTQPTWNSPIQTISGKFNKWPVEPCDCGEECECYRTTVLRIPHRNELMLKALRSALSEFASDIMLRTYDELIESPRGKVVIQMLLEENGVNMSELKHVFVDEVKYHLKSKTLLPRLETLTLLQHSNDECALTVTLPNLEDTENEDDQNYTITLVSEDGLDGRTYAVQFNTSETQLSATVTSSGQY